MKKWTMVIDVEKCEDCNNCFLACKDEHCGNDWPGYAASQTLHGQRWMNILRRERGQFPIIDVAYLPKPCQHCDKAPCIKAAQNEAVYKRPDGIVIIDPQKAKGQKALLKACPYGAIWWNAESDLPQKCTLCAHLLDEGWKAPRCVQACPTGALSIFCIEDDELSRMIETQGLEMLDNKDRSARPGVYYKNLYRFNGCFIAGSVATGKDSAAECVAGATVRLTKDEMVIQETATDAFGDFKFDRLSSQSGAYRIEIQSGKFMPQTIDVNLTESQAIGTVWI